LVRAAVVGKGTCHPLHGGGPAIGSTSGRRRAELGRLDDDQWRGSGRRGRFATRRTRV